MCFCLEKRILSKASLNDIYGILKIFQMNNVYF